MSGGGRHDVERNTTQPQTTRGTDEHAVTPFRVTGLLPYPLSVDPSLDRGRLPTRYTKISSVIGRLSYHKTPHVIRGLHVTFED